MHSTCRGARQREERKDALLLQIRKERSKVISSYILQRNEKKVCLFMRHSSGVQTAQEQQHGDEGSSQYYFSFSIYL